ncbi:MAG TPA: FtsX-like permease family protein [Spirochaetales bacterium]|nr:FtsX-like permease family protein [Spirochaetales bacterium]
MRVLIKIAFRNLRELTVRGIFRFKQSNPQLDRVSLVDINNLRILEGMTLTSGTEIELDEREQSLLGDFSEKDLFGDTPGDGAETLLIEEVASTGKDLSLEPMRGLFGRLDERKQISQTDSGAWHFLLIKLKDPNHITGVTADINSFLSDREIDAGVSDWLSFAGMGAEMAYSIKSVFNILIMIIAVVAVIIIMNTLVISVTERIPEIGTMRAIGAQKSFVRRMILIETVMISGIFGLIGILLGVGVLGILYLSGIQAPE